MELLTKNNLKITCAESCTGGLLASAITSVSGSSECFEGSFVTYSNDIKHKIINVKEDTLNNFGAVSKECVIEMSKNSKDIIHSDMSIAVSGIAGPKGGTKDKPVGLVFIAFSFKNETFVYKNIFEGNREDVRLKSVLFSLNVAIDFLSKNI